jgi:hypothetical protein
LEEGVETRRLVRANRVGECPSDRGGLACRWPGQPRLGEPLRDDLILFRTIGAAKRASIDGAALRRLGL